MIKPLVSHTIHFLLLWAVCAALTIGGYTVLFLIKTFSGDPDSGSKAEKEVPVVDPFTATMHSAIDMRVTSVFDSKLGPAVDQAIEHALGAGLETAMDTAVDQKVSRLLRLLLDDTVVVTPLVPANSGELRRALEESLRTKLVQAFESAMEKNHGPGLSRAMDEKIQKSVGSALQKILCPVIRTAVQSSLRVTLTSGVKQKVGSSVRSALSKNLGPALITTLKKTLDSPITATLQSTLETALGTAVTTAVDDQLKQVMDDALERQLVPAIEFVLTQKGWKPQDPTSDVQATRSIGTLAIGSALHKEPSSHLTEPNSPSTTTTSAQSDDPTIILTAVNIPPNDPRPGGSSPSHSPSRSGSA